MANKSIGNLIIKAKNCTIWINGYKLTNTASYDAKATRDYDEVKVIGDDTTYKSPKGYKIEGSLKLNKVDDYVFNMVADAFENGELLDAKIISSQATVDGKAQRIALTGVDISELPLGSVEADGTVQEEFPFSAEKFQRLDTIK